MSNPKILLPREEKQVANKKYLVYTLDGIKKAFENYNLIIFTTEGTYDTSNYNFIDAKTTFGFDTNGLQTNTDGYIEIGYTPDLNNDGTPVVPIQSVHFLPQGERGHKLVRIPRYSITKIVVKSKRDFLLNQGKAKKLS